MAAHVVLPDGRKLGEAIEALTGEAPTSLQTASGGDIGQSWRASLASGERVFVKHYADAPDEVVTREAEGLRWLAEPGVVPVAAVRGVAPAARLLVLAWIEPGRPDRNGDAAFGRGLAALHRSGAECFGALPDNFIGPLPQSNTPHATWAGFYGQERLAPQFQLARERGRLDARDATRADALIGGLGTLFPEEPPSRVHGDLWGGNRLCDFEGRSWLIDPAAHGGHREMDLAMMQLFGGFSDAVFSAYLEDFPLAPDAEERVPLCQLYPLLVHANLFGGHYVDSVRRTLDRFA